MDAGGAEDAGGAGGDSAADTDAGGTIDTDGGADADGGATVCLGTHPLVEGARRYCNPGDCYCSDPDACFPTATATACCGVAVVCGGAGTDGGTDAGPVMCIRTHPIVEGTRRYCNAGDCYCSDPDACFPTATATACCGVAVVCGSTDGGTDAGPLMCMATHPIVEGTRRYCNPGACYCSAPDACFPAATATACCGAAPVC